MSEASRPAETLDSSVRQRLLQAASEMFAQKGYAATTVREIVAAAGVTKPVLYYYFQNKEGLYLELMETTSRRFLGVLEETQMPGTTPRQRITRLGELVFLVFLENIQVMKVIHSTFYGPPQGAPFVDFTALHQHFHDEVINLVREGMAKGEFKPGDSQVVTWALLGAEHMAMDLELCLPDQSMGLDGLRQVTGLILDAVSAAKP
jgi:TetR/AcrR family transcriptional regulator